MTSLSLASVLAEPGRRRPDRPALVEGTTRATYACRWVRPRRCSSGSCALETLTFEELPGDRTRLRILSVVESFEFRDSMLASGMETGVNEGYEKLDELLASLS